MGGWRVTRGEGSGWVKRVEGGGREWGGGGLQGGRRVVG